MTREELVNSKEYKQEAIDNARWRVRADKRTLIRKIMGFLKQFSHDSYDEKRIYLPELYKRK